MAGGQILVILPDFNRTIFRLVGPSEIIFLWIAEGGTNQSVFIVDFSTCDSAIRFN